MLLCTKLHVLAQSVLFGHLFRKTVFEVIKNSHNDYALSTFSFNDDTSLCLGFSVIYYALLEICRSILLILNFHVKL